MAEKIVFQQENIEIDSLIIHSIICKNESTLHCIRPT